mmetsp:Transcript_40990/g.64666  ORF Transcript_40990/g.64666 Transcript_40990/m.64666 type:complete len:262 (+) Transcript_40990:45-830(+)
MVVRRSYAGLLRGGYFEPRKVTRLDDLSEADQEAIVNDIITERIRKIQALNEKFALRALKEEQQAQEAFQWAKEEEEQRQKHQEERRRRSADAFEVFARRAQQEAMAKERQAAELVAQLRRKDQQAAEAAKLAEARRLQLQSQRLARHQKLRMEADAAARQRRAQLRASAQQRALALDAQVPTTAPQRRPATAPPGRLDGAARARQQGLSRFAASLDSAHGHYSGSSRPKSATGLRRAWSAPSTRRPRSACCISCGAVVQA